VIVIITIQVLSPPFFCFIIHGWMDEVASGKERGKENINKEATFACEGE